MDQSQVVIYPIICQVCAGEGLGAGDQSPQKSVKHCTAFPEQRSVWYWQCARLCVSGAGQRWALPSIPLGMCVCVCVHMYVCACTCEAGAGEEYGCYCSWSLSRIQLFVTPCTVACQAPLGFSRQEYWRGLPFPSPGDLPDTETESGSPALQADYWPSEPPGKPREEYGVIVHSRVGPAATSAFQPEKSSSLAV